MTLNFSANIAERKTLNRTKYYRKLQRGLPPKFKHLIKLKNQKLSLTEFK